MRLVLQWVLVSSLLSLAANSSFASVYDAEWSPDSVTSSVESSAQSKSLEEITLEQWSTEANIQLSEEQRLEKEIQEAYELSKPLKSKKIAKKSVRKGLRSQSPSRN